MPKTISTILSPYNIATASGVAIFFVADRLCKAAALAATGELPRQLIGGLLSFHFTPNRYIAFSLPLSGPWLNILLVLVISVLLAYILYRPRHQGQGVETALLIVIFVGALSNLIDRLAYGYVVDYLDLKYFTVFNLADVMITGGALVLVIKNLKKS